MLFSSSSLVHAAETVNIYFFYGQGCPHCAKERMFLDKLATVNKDIALHDFEVYYDPVGRGKFIEATEKLNTQVNGVPFLVIGDKYLVGYLSDETTGKEIATLVETHRKNGCFDIFSSKETNNISPKDPVIEEECDQSSDVNKPALPMLGNISLDKLSLPVLTIVLGFLDGFNPCAMWVLLFLISLLIGMEDKRKMWLLGVAFIVSSALVYFIFMVAWLNLFQFVGYIHWVRIGIALIAFIGGISSIRKYFNKDSTGCDVENSEKKKKIFDRLGKITSNKSLLFALIGIIGLAFAVNLVELVCSAGLPAVYTQVLSMNKMVGVNYYLYILLYILFFMLDDLFVFVVAMTTLTLTGITTKYVKYTRLLGGILMISIGAILILNPGLLMFSN